MTRILDDFENDRRRPNRPEPRAAFATAAAAIGAENK